MRLVVFLALLLVMACARSEELPSARTDVSDSILPSRSYPPPSNPLLADLRRAFQERNPRIEHVGIMDLRWFWGAQPVFVGHGVRGDKDFQGDWEDELIGIFYADDSLTHVTRVVDVFPTHAWLDLDVGFERAYYPVDSIRVIGMGATHGEFGFRRAYARTAGIAIRSR